MVKGLTQGEIEEWVKKDSANSITNTSQFLYRFAANIPGDVLNFLLNRQSSGSLYFGSVLRVTEFNNNSFYTLGFYSVKFNGVQNEFIISRANYNLVNYSVDWRKYIDSTDYINLDITLLNIDNTNLYYAQATKLDNEYGLVQHSQTPSVTEGRSAIFRGNKTYVYYSRTIGGNVNQYVQIPGEIYTSFGVTPSVLKLAQYNPSSNTTSKKSEETKKSDNTDYQINPATR